MNKEVISDKQGISIIILYMSGTSSILVFGIIAKQDIWLATIISILMALFTACIFGRLHYIFPGKNLFDIFESCCGKIIGRGITVLYIWFAIHEGTLVGMNIYQFITDTILSETPNIAVFILLLLICTYFVKKGIEVIGRWAELMFIPTVVFVTIIALLLIPNMKINNIRPVLKDGIMPALKGAFVIFSFPFGEIVTFSMVFSIFRTKKSPYRIYIIGLLIGGVIVFITSLTTVLVIGVNSASEAYYPVYKAFTRIKIAGFIQNFEVIGASSFIVGGFLKVSIYILAVSKGISNLFNLKDYRFIVIPIVVQMLNMSYFLHYSRIEYNKWNFEIFPYYAFPFEMIIPVIIWFVAEIRFNRLGYKQLRKL